MFNLFIRHQNKRAKVWLWDPKRTASMILWAVTPQNGRRRSHCPNVEHVVLLQFVGSKNTGGRETPPWHSTEKKLGYFPSRKFLNPSPRVILPTAGFHFWCQQYPSQRGNFFLKAALLISPAVYKEKEGLLDVNRALTARLEILSHKLQGHTQ